MGPRKSQRKNPEWFLPSEVQMIRLLLLQNRRPLRGGTRAHGHRSTETPTVRQIDALRRGNYKGGRWHGFLMLQQRRRGGNDCAPHRIRDVPYTTRERRNGDELLETSACECSPEWYAPGKLMMNSRARCVTRITGMLCCLRRLGEMMSSLWRRNSGQDRVRSGTSECTCGEGEVDPNRDSN